MKRKIFFWQNIISPHQIDLLKELSYFFKINLIVVEEIDELRRGDKWNVPDTSFLELFVNPRLNRLNGFFRNPEDVHIFSGIQSYDLIKKGFKLAIKTNSKIGLLSEPMNWYGVKGKIRYLRGCIERIRFGKRINFILAIGVKGRWWFERLGYSQDILFDFGYFVNPNVELLKYKKSNSIIFVGRINWNKGVFDLIDIASKYTNMFDVLRIYGDGALKNRLIKLLIDKKLDKKITYHGLVNNAEIKKALFNSSFLVLPSKEKDGWGVVVNESLQSGTPVLLSSNVGASILIKDSNRGLVFEANNLIDFEQKFSEMLTKKYEYDDYERIINWSDSFISPQTAAEYFKDIIHFVFDKTKNKPHCPWIKLN